MEVNIHISPNEIQKFVLVYGVIEDGEETVLFWGNPHAKWHKDIVEEITESGFTNLRIIGGGKVYFSSVKKSVYVWGTSSRYGKVSDTEVQTIFRDAFPEYSLVHSEFKI